MLLYSVEIKNYRSLEHVTLDNFQQFNVLIGRNNAGKSAIFQALYDRSRYRKSEDALLIAKEIQPEEIDQEISDVIEKAYSLVPS